MNCKYYAIFSDGTWEMEDEDKIEAVIASHKFPPHFGEKGNPCRWALVFPLNAITFSEMRKNI